MQNAELKELRSFRRGRVNSKSEVRSVLRMRTNYERLLFSNLRMLFKNHIDSVALLVEQQGEYDVRLQGRELYNDMSPLMISYLRRVFVNTYKFYDEMYEGARKSAEAEVIVFGRVLDIERLVNEYFAGREQTLANIPVNIARRIYKLINDGRADGLTLPQIARDIRTKILPLTRSRAAMIARTETHNAASFASHNYHKQVQQDLGVSMYKQWVAVNDSRTRSAHSEANGQRVHMDEKFNVGGTEMSYTGDPAGGAKNVINCRCVLIYADEKDIVV